MINSFGKAFTLTTFGESHGKAIGGIVDGVPTGLEIDEAFIQSELERRRPGKIKEATARKETDKIEFFSGIFEGKATGTPTAFAIVNRDQKARHYDNVKDLFRPSHADFTYHHKYGIRDYRGGGRSSARETAARVGAGAIAKLMLKRMGIRVASALVQVGEVKAEQIDFAYAATSALNAANAEDEKRFSKIILEAKAAHDSVGGVIETRAFGVPVGLGEPLYHKLDAKLAEAMMSINAAKAVEIGAGFDAPRHNGSTFNDEIAPEGFITNHSGGILGGISNGEEIVVRTYFKPTPSIFQEQRTIDKEGNAVTFKLEGRHDPCVAVRAGVICEAMMALVLADMALLNLGRRIEHLEAIYGKIR